MRWFLFGAVVASAVGASTVSAATLQGVTGWSISRSPLTEVGRGPEYPLLQATHAARQSDGTIIVADGLASEVHAFSANGDHLKQLGREGDGPGEFRWPVRVQVLAGDSVVVFDAGHQRLTFFTPDLDVDRVARV